MQIRTKIQILFILVCFLVFPFQNTSASLNSSTNVVQTNYLKLTVNIVNLTVQLDSTNSFSYGLLFRTYNPNNFSVTLTQDHSCGFDILLGVISNYEELGFVNGEPCISNFDNPYAIIYQPGYTTQQFSSSASYFGYDGNDFPIGFYFLISISTGMLIL